MLNTLVIHDIVLIEELHLQLDSGLLVMTGETGAGKSIVLDALGLVMGNRADTGLVRRSAEKGSVSAHFDVPTNHPAYQILADQDIDVDQDGIIVRRVVGRDGKSKAYVNDNPVSAGLLRSLGEVLVEVHGQHDDRGLLNSSGHRALLDNFALVKSERSAVAKAHKHWQDVSKKLDEELRSLEALREEQEYDQHNLDELIEMNPVDEEEGELDSKRRLMMQGEKALGDVKDILKGLEIKGGTDALLRGAASRLIKLNEGLDGHLDDAIETLSMAAEQTSLGVDALRIAQRDMVFENDTLEFTEERLFALRALARKHRCDVSALPQLRLSLEEKLKTLSRGEQELERLKDEQQKAYQGFTNAVKKLSQKRIDAAKKLSKSVMVELPPLKLENAIFKVDVTPLDEANWTSDGGERIEFLIATNKGSDLAPMIKVASGGELSRIILALKVVLAKTGSAPTLIFDEVDRGIGGATADAVGERLKALANDAQVLVVTHSPQVAARGTTHMRITKFDVADDKGVETYTKVVGLTDDERREEIARMLAGASVTSEARAAAERLMKAG